MQTELVTQPLTRTPMETIFSHPATIPRELLYHMAIRLQAETAQFDPNLLSLLM
jgi:hypothetical protein